jgi:hypothetical protein
VQRDCHAMTREGQFIEFVEFVGFVELAQLLGFVEIDRDWSGSLDLPGLPHAFQALAMTAPVCPLDSDIWILSVIWALTFGLYLVFEL